MDYPFAPFFGQIRHLDLCIISCIQVNRRVWQVGKRRVRTVDVASDGIANPIKILPAKSEQRCKRELSFPSIILLNIKTNQRLS